MRRSLILILLAGLGFSGISRAQFFLSGQITDPNGTGVFNVDIDMWDSNTGNPIGLLADSTDASGNYNLDPPFGLPAGTYDIAFKPPAGSGLAPVLNRNYVLSGDQVLNDTVPFGFTLSGFVRDTGGTGIPDADLNVDDELTGERVYTPTDNSDASGFYSVVIPAGVYTLTYRPPQGEKLVPVEIRGVVFNANQTRDVILEPGFLVSGRVEDNQGQPVVDADLDFDVSANGAPVVTPNDNTNSNGDYQIIVPAGTYDITVEPQKVDKLVAGQRLSIAITNDTNNMDFVLDPGFYLSGLVRRAGNLTPVAGANIDVDDAATGRTIPTPGDNTDASGQYQVVVPAGNLNITVEPPVADKLAAGQKLSVPIGADTTIDFDLSGGFYLSGIVRRAGSLAPVSGADIDVEDTLTGQKIPTPGGGTDAAGFYQTVVPSGNFNVVFQPPASTGLASVESLRVAVIADRTLNAALPAGLALSGSVQKTEGGGLPNVNIRFVNPATGARVPLADHVTNALGNYTVVAVSGTYDVQFEPPKSTRRVAKEFPDFSLNSNAILNVALDSGQSISGFIKDSLDNPIRDVDLDADLLPSGGKVFTPSDNTDSTGFYQVIVPAANLNLAYTPTLVSRFAGVSFAGVSIANDTAINLTLRHGVQLSGAVRDSAGSPITGVRVRVFGSPEVPLAKGTTDLAGNFAGILVPGTYSLHFNPTPTSLFDSLVVSSVQVRVDSTIAVTLPLKPFSGLKGDLSNDGFLTAADAVLMLSCVFLGGGTCPLSAADLDCNGNLSAADAVLELNQIFLGAGLPC